MITYKYIQIFIFIHIYLNTFSDYLRPARLCAGQQYCQSLETLEILPQIGSIAARTTYATTYYTYQGQRILNTVQILLTHTHTKLSNRISRTIIAPFASLPHQIHLYNNKKNGIYIRN